MAVTTQRLSTVDQARSRRLNLPRYLQLDGSRYLLGLVVILCLMSLIVLAQTGVVATKGYEIARLEAERVSLLRERSALQVRQARAQSLSRVRLRAEQIGLRPYSDAQVRYVTIPELLPPPDTSGGE